jgi:hypothetical protein
MRSADRLSLARAAALIAVAELCVHQLRYLLSFGGAAGDQLARQGHSYLAGAAPVLAALAVSLIAAGVLRAALGGRRPIRFASLPRRTALFALAILAVYCVQESVEGVLSPGHPAGLAALLAHSGLLAVPLSIACGAVGALLDRSFSCLEQLVAAHLSPARRRSRAAPRARLPRSPGLAVRAASPLAFGLARRPPPLPF